MADTTGLGQAYVDAQKAILEYIARNVGETTGEAIHHYADAYRALAEHSPRSNDPRASVKD